MKKTYTAREGLAPEDYTMQCDDSEGQSRCVALMPYVYICSPFRATNPQERERNIALARWACRSNYKLGRIPIAPHLLFPQFLDDSHPEEREFALQVGLRLLDMCQMMAVYSVDGIISEGMRGEIDYCTNTLGRQVIWQDMTGDEVANILQSKTDTKTETEN